MSSASSRLLSLDVFRGITILGMILVNNPGSWSYVYPPLLHANWHGITPTDLIFPFFLFIVGVAITFSIQKQVDIGKSKAEVIQKAGLRSLIIFLLGLFLAGFPYFGGSEMPEPRIFWYVFLLAHVPFALLIREITRQKRAKVTYAKRTQLIWTGILLFFTVLTLVVGLPYFDLSSLRIPGVLQRIALVYIVSVVVFLYFGWKNQILLLGALLIVYWLLMTWVPVPGVGAANLEPETNLGAWLDRTLLSTDHLWSQSKVWDPEGLLSTIPAVGTGILGMLAGALLRSDREEAEKTVWLFVVGSLCMLIGLTWDLVFPVNKKLWTSSYVLYSGGLAMFFLAICYWVIDVKGYKQWTPAFAAYGVNAITVFVASGLLAKTLLKVKVAGEQSLWSWIYENIYASWLNPYMASLFFAISFVVILWLPMWFFYKQRIIIKV